MSYLAKFSKYGEDENVFHKWVKSDLDDEQLKGSGLVVNGIVNVILEIYKVNDLQAPSYIELPEKYKRNQSIINIKNNDQFCFFYGSS